MSPMIRLALVAGVLVVLVLVFANPFEDSIRETPSETAPLFPAVEDADRIEITTEGSEPVILARAPSGWVVESRSGFPADTAAVGTMLRAIGNARSTTIASDNPENQSRFQVDAGGARVAVSSAGEPRAHFVLGKVGRDFTTSYLRVEDADAVHVVRGLNRGMLNRPQGFRDRTLFSFEVNEVRSVRLDGGVGGWEVVRGDTAWTAQETGRPTPAVARTEVVEQLLQELSALNADTFLDDPADTVQTGLEDPAYTLTVGFMNGSQTVIAVGGENQSQQRFVSRLDRPATYLLSTWRVNNLAKTYPDLVAASEGE